MKKPGQRGSRYAPRGKSYAPRRRPDVAATPADPPSEDQVEPDVATAAVAAVDHVADDSAEPHSVALPQATRAERWQPRQSVVIPIALTIVALALMQHFPAYRLQAGSVEAVASDGVKGGDVTRLAMVTDDGIETLSSSAAPVAERAQAPLPLSVTPADDVAVRDIGHLGAVPLVRACTVPEEGPHNAAGGPLLPELFGSALASAAEAQTREFVVYDDKYRVIRYPGGDVATLYGVCTDVIVRAYRALGIDLQKLVHEAQVGSGDTNISHRRTEALRRFFKKSGASVEITDFAEDYQAGDVVTYHRPQNSGSNDHIAIVSNVTGPSGAPMIVHNRGFGPQVEDALFVDEITGHFRYRGPALQQPASQPKVGAQSKTAAVRVAERASHRMRNSAVRKIRRAAAVRAASGSSSAKHQPKL